MKMHYINILLFALTLNLLINDQRNHKSTTPSHTPTTRLLCECELYTPVNYDSDPEMKKIMENFNKQTQERFHEYDENMVEKRKQCKVRCDKEIQKIILKDKIEKELMDKFATLQTDIQNDAIPTCVCEKSLADKVEKGCLRCGYGIGTVAPTVGLIGSVAVGAWKNTLIDVAIELAKEAGALAGKAAGLKEGMNVVTNFLKESYVKELFPGIWEKISNAGHFTKVTDFAELIFTKKLEVCSVQADSSVSGMCGEFDIYFGFYDRFGNAKAAPKENPITNVLKSLVEQATEAADTEAARMTTSETAAAIETNTGVVQTASYNWYTTIGYSILAILIIILIMVIIYLILRYRRKKKMKKKLQYIKLLEE
ncbi:rifin PIR protein, putative [Plasmodium reichenowi]|uniref:Rifin PIR protein, putative n=1 Tax=Plasmodium reichenowi TaxID=5854 RepID=A0A2P9DSE9_PLARE|nr:rifin PIR protein, putative [Plasmodium reichenowi]